MLKDNTETPDNLQEPLEIGGFKRRGYRRKIEGAVQRAQRAQVILGIDGASTHRCQILDASETGYRIALAMPVNIDDEFILDHGDGLRCLVRVRWTDGSETGLEVISKTRQTLK